MNTFPEVGGYENGGDQEPAEHVAESQLEEAPVRSEGEAGNAGESENARLGGDDAGGDRPPGDAPFGEEVIVDGLPPPSQIGAEERDGGEIQDEDGESRKGKIQGRRQRTTRPLELTRNGGGRAASTFLR